MLSLRCRAALPVLCIVAAVGSTSCRVDEDGNLLVADATFDLASAGDCVTAFEERPFLRRLARRRGWGGDEIGALCQELTDIRDMYVTDSTLTVVSVAALATVSEAGDFGGAFYVGAAGYNLTAIRNWLGEVRASAAVGPCTREAARMLRNGESLGDNFMRRCLERETGSPYPEPIFQPISLTTVSLSEVDSAAAGLAASLVIYNVPGQGAVAAFVAGGFYAQAEPPYGAFVGCGVAAGFEDVAEVGRAEDDTGASVAGTFICLGAEY